MALATDAATQRTAPGTHQLHHRPQLGLRRDREVRPCAALARYRRNVSLLIPCRRVTSVHRAPASISRTMP
jgi:hypothetical protein